MIIASIKAWLIDKDSDKSQFLALEPKVAGIYYYIASSLTKDAKNIFFINEGKPFIIYDIWAGIVLFAFIEKLSKIIKYLNLLKNMHQFEEIMVDK